MLLTESTLYSVMCSVGDGDDEVLNVNGKHITKVYWLMQSSDIKELKQLSLPSVISISKLLLQ